jgi:hypothetical protein
MTTLKTLAQLSHHLYAMEDLTEREPRNIASGSPLALNNLLARLARLQQTIETAAKETK